MDEAPTFLAIDGHGDPILLAVATATPRGPRDKSGPTAFVPVKSGNPWRTGAGTFGSGPAGAKVKQGGDLLSGLSNPAKLYITQIKNQTGADSLSAVRNGERIHVELTKGSVVVSRLDLPVGGGDQPSAFDGSRDAVVDRARAAQPINRLDQAAREQRIHDLVDYLYARYNASGAIFSKPGTVHVAAPAGWDKKTIGGLTDNELADVTKRLVARGWTQDSVNKVVLPNIPAARRTKIAG